MTPNSLASPPRRTLALVGGLLALLGAGACSRPATPITPRKPAPPAPEPVATRQPTTVEPPQRVAGLAPRQRIVGLAGLRTRSAIRFVSDPETPHTLTTTYCFPDLARIELRVVAGGPDERVVDYRFGSRVFELGPNSGASEELEPDLRDELLRRMELRRAAFLWPDGFEWSEREGARFAKLSAGELPLGFLVADTPTEAPPRRIDVHRPDGSLGESLVIQAWSQQGTRSFPEILSVQFGEQPVWTETVEKLETSVLFRDALFLPADRLDLLPPSERVVRGTLPRLWVASIPLVGPRSWEAAEGLYHAQAAGLLARLPSGLQLEPLPAYEIAADGLPAAVLIRLQGVSEGDPPPGFGVRSSSRCLQIEVLELRGLGGGELDALQSYLPPGAVPLGLLALPTGQASGAYRLVLPFEG